MNMKKIIFLLLPMFLYHNTYAQKQIMADGIVSYDGKIMVIRKNQSLIFLDNKGEIVASNIKIKPNDRYMVDYSFYKGVAYDYNPETKLYRLINDKGEGLTDYKYKTIKPFVTDNTWVVSEDEEIKFINLKGEEIASMGEEFLEKFNLSSDTKIMLNVLSDYQKKAESVYHEGLRPITNPETKKIGFIDYDNNFIIQANYNKTSKMSEGLVAVSNDNYKWGYINNQGETVIPFNYSIQPGDFSNDRALVRTKDAFYGYIDKEGNLIIEPKYKYATDFYKGFALVKQDRLTSTLLIDKEGNVNQEFELDLGVNPDINNLKSLINTGYITANARVNINRVTKVKKAVILDSTKTISTKHYFYKITHLKNKNAIGIRDGKRGLIGVDGEFIFEIVKNKNRF